MMTGFPRKFLYPLVVSAIVLFLAIVNYVPGTWLLGWDSLSDEFNFKVNAQRQFFGVWNEYQGLGTAGGHAHSADIPRFLYLVLASLVFPDNLLRYSYFFFTLLVGALGMYYFASYLFRDSQYKKHLALAAASFYIFNLGTLQIFYVPFEMFNAQFMVLPWIFMYVIKYVKHGSLKDYLKLCFFIFLGTPQGYAPVLYYALIASIAGYLFIYLFTHVGRVKTSLRSLYIGGAFIFLNLYWILPNMYYIKNYSTSVSESKINKLFSEEAFLYSTKWGTWLDFPILRGFLFGWLDYKYSIDEIYYLMDHWRMYMANPLVLAVGILFFAIITLGLIMAILKRKAILISFIPVFFLWLFMVIGANGILAPIWDFLRSNFELFREGLRFPYSKFSVLLQFGYSIFFIYGLVFIIGFFTKIPNKNVDTAKKIFLWIFIAAPILYMYPFFTGNLIAREMQIKLVSEYSNLFSKFEKEDPNKRIVYLPANNLFGWQYYDWGNEGYQGAGFVWFGLAQSFVTRDFDRWHPANEQFYTELQYAIYNKDSGLFEYLLKKYDVSYVVLDRNIISPNNPKSLFYEDTDELLEGVKNLVLTDTIGNLKVYKYRDVLPSESYVEAPGILVTSRNIKVEDGYGYYDTNYVDDVNNYFEQNIFENSGIANIIENRELTLNLQSDNTKDKLFTMSIPFASRRETIPVEFTLEDSGLKIRYLYPEIYSNNGEAIFTNVPSDLFPSISVGASQVLINNKLLNSSTLNTISLIDENSQIVEFSKGNTGVFEYSGGIYSASSTDCNGSEDNVAKVYDKYPGSVRVETINGVTGCLDFQERISNSQPVIYKVSFDYQNSDAAVPMYCLSSAKTGECFNRQYENRPESSVDNFIYYEDYVLVEDPAIVKLAVVLASDDHLTSVSGIFKNIKIERYEVYKIRNLLNPALRGLERNVSVDSSDFPLKVVFPDYSGLSTVYFAGDRKYNTNARSCDKFSIKSYKRDLIDESSGRKAYLYTAEDAISCDTLEASIINPNSSYLITFDTEKLQAQGLDVCLWGISTEKCLLQERLKGGKETFLLPSYSSAGGVNINFNNPSIGRVTTSNKLYGVNVSYLPYAWLKEIIIRDSVSGITSDIERIFVQKKSLYQYDIKLEPQGSAETQAIVALNQSFDKGWVLLDKNSCFIGIIAPGFCKEPESKHFMYNGWANGWYFTAEGPDYSMIFWPQLLQVIGYLVFALFTAYLGVLALVGIREKTAI